MAQLTAYDKFIQQALKYGFSLWGTAKTKQTTKYRTGDDGDFEKGYPKTPPRFVDNGDGTITDNATGLMWVKQPENIGGIWISGGEPVERTWNQAIDDCLALNYAGHDDWRLPNAKELFSLIDFGRSNPCLSAVYFPNTKSDRYGVSTTFIIMTTFTFFIDFNWGGFGVDAKVNTNYQRPVRLGVPK